MNQWQNTAMKLRVRELRKKSGWTGDHLAELVGASKSYISEIETGKKFPSGRLLKAFSKVFEVSIYELIEDGDTGADIAAHMEVMKDLSEDDRRAVVRHALGLLQKEPE